MMTDHAGKMRLLWRSLAIAGGLIAIKVGVFYVTNSVAILASAADSFMDFLMSMANFLLLRAAAEPADDQHPYGHGKYESLAGLAQSLIIGAMALGLSGMAVDRLKTPQSIQQPGAGIAMTVLGLVVNLWHTRNLRASMLASQSPVMAGEFLHYASDTLVYLGVLISFLLFAITDSSFWDPVISLLIVIYLIKNVAEIFQGTLTELLDVQLPKAVLEEIDGIIRSFDPRIAGYHNLRTRKVGPTKFIEFHVELRQVEMFRDAHDLTQGLIVALKKKYPGAVVTVHADPEEPT